MKDCDEQAGAAHEWYGGAGEKGARVTPCIHPKTML
jgi:hypothetical protein